MTLIRGEFSKNVTVVCPGVVDLLCKDCNKCPVGLHPTDDVLELPSSTAVSRIDEDTDTVHPCQSGPQFSGLQCLLSVPSRLSQQWTSDAGVNEGPSFCL